MSKQSPWQLTIRDGWQTYLPILLQAVDNGEEKTAVDAFLHIFDHALNHCGWGTTESRGWMSEASLEQKKQQIYTFISELINACNLTPEINVHNALFSAVCAYACVKWVQTWSNQVHWLVLTIFFRQKTHPL